MRFFFIRKTKLLSKLNVAHSYRAVRGCRRAVAASLGLELFDAFEKNVADDGQGFGADFVERILRSVPVIDVAAGAVIEIDYVHRWNVAFQKRLMIVFDRG